MARKRTAAAAAFVPPSGDKALNDLFAPLRAAAIARILKAVGKSTENGGQLAIGTDAEIQLATDIFEAYVATPIQLDPHEDSKATERLRRVKSIREAVEKQAALISADPYLSKAIGKAEGIKPPPILELHIELLTLETQLSLLADKWQRKADLPPELKGRRPSEPEWLAGVALPLVYERHFFSSAGRSRNAKGEAGGPTVRFVEATMSELGIPYSPESIVRAFTRLRRQREIEKARKEVV
jgi:hypothetical protein